MIGSKSQSQVRPVALGATVSAANYGVVIPVIMGRAKSPLYLTWNANLRSGGSEKNAKKILSFGIKKHSEGNIENVEYLMGHNPVMGALQVWANQNQRYPLKFASASGPTITDTNFYMVIGVSVVQAIFSTTFNDYGAPGPTIIPDGTMELPLWNAAYHGPDPTCPKVWDYGDSYYWTPAQGNAIGSGGKVYYAQLDPHGSELYSKKAMDTAVPIAALRMTFEPVMGDGPEFQGDDNTTGDPLVNKRIYYPAYCGLGSPNIDLGKGTAPPDMKLETMGSYPLYPSGDADFCDMFEAIIKQGPGQPGFAPATDPANIKGMNIHGIQWGLGCYNFPGTIQRRKYSNVLFGATPVPYDQPNVAGNLLIVMGTSYNTGASSPTLTLGISDLAGNDWTPILPTPNQWQVWWAIAKPYIGNKVQVTGLDANVNVVVAEIGGVDQLDNISWAYGDTATVASTLDDGVAGYLLAFGLYNDFSVYPPDDVPQWNSLLKNNGTHFSMLDRQIYNPGEYTIKTPFAYPWAPAATVVISMKNSEAPKWPRSVMGDILDKPSLEWTRLQCRANGLFGSMCLDSQVTARDILNDLLDCMNARAFWSGSKLKVMPRSEVSTIGWGTAYRPPTSDGPIVLRITDFVGDPDKPHYVIENKSQVDIPNTIQIQHPDRDSDYNDTTTSEPESANMAMLGPRKDSPKQYRMVQSPAVARKILKTKVYRHNYIERHSINFNLNGRWDLLEPGQLLTLPGDPLVGLSAIDVILTKVEIDPEDTVVCESEPFIWGAHDPVDLPVTGNVGYTLQIGADPGPINVPILFEPPPRMLEANAKMQIWLVLSAPGLNYGGAGVYISTDGGAGYDPVGIINGNAATGFTTGAWASILSDTDTANDLPVNLTESNGTLDMHTASEEDNFLTACYVGSAVPPSTFMIPLTEVDYEIMCYAQANLTSLSHYTLSATGGNHLRRGVFGAQFLGVGSSHVTNSRFAFLGSSKGEQPGILKLNIDQKWVGQTVYFKFCQFNKFQGRMYPLATATPYPYTFNGVSWVRTVFGNYTVQPGDGPLNVDTTNGAIAITLPADAPNTDTLITKTSVGGGNVTLVGGGPGVPTTQLITQFDNVGVQSSNQGWTQTTTNVQNNVDNETPAGAMNGVNMTFTLSKAPSPPACLRLYYKGLLLINGVDFTLTGNTITMLHYKLDSTKGDSLRAFYRF